MEIGFLSLSSLPSQGSNPAKQKREIQTARVRISLLMSMGYEKDIFAVFAYEFEPSP